VWWPYIQSVCWCYCPADPVCLYNYNFNYLLRLRCCNFGWLNILWRVRLLLRVRQLANPPPKTFPFEQIECCMYCVRPAVPCRSCAFWPGLVFMCFVWCLEQSVNFSTNSSYWCVLDSFANFRKASGSFFVSLIPSSREISALTGRIFMKFDIWVFLETE
jgi:hypothetical protein